MKYDHLFPPSRQLIPRMDTVSVRSWVDMGGARLYEDGYPEYMWQEKFFGVHLNNTQSQRHKKPIDVEKLFEDWIATQK